MKLHPSGEGVLGCAILHMLTPSRCVQTHLSDTHISSGNTCDCTCFVVQHLAHCESWKDVDLSSLGLRPLSYSQTRVRTRCTLASLVTNAACSSADAFLATVVSCLTS